MPEHQLCYSTEFSGPVKRSLCTLKILQANQTEKYRGRHQIQWLLKFVNRKETRQEFRLFVTPKEFRHIAQGCKRQRATRGDEGSRYLNPDGVASSRTAGTETPLGYAMIDDVPTQGSSLLLATLGCRTELFQSS